jgi:hypothetical protein
MPWESQTDDGTGLKRQGTAAFTIQEDSGKPAHVRFVAHTEDTRATWIALQQVEHRPYRTVSSQYSSLFYLSGKLQCLSHEVGSLPCPQQGTAEEVVEWLEEGRQSADHEALLMPTLFG